MTVEQVRPALRVAVVGAGPAGFYAAAAVLTDGPDAAGVAVDILDRLPTPWGLVRSGVAPDHPKIKSISRVFEGIAATDGVRFLGNVELGSTVTREELLELYDAVVYATGSAADRHLGIPGEELAGVHGASEFVGWYNGHPDYVGREFDLSGEHAVVFGVGNVALDVGRILVTDPDVLARTDIADAALAALRESRVRDVTILGRRGPAQASFTPVELGELRQLPGAVAVVDPADLKAAPLPHALVPPPQVRRNLTVLQDLAEAWVATGEPDHRRLLRLQFFQAPVALHGDGRVEEVELERTSVLYDADGAPRAVATGERRRIPARLVLRAVGYQGSPLPGVPFDPQRSVLRNEAGRIVDDDDRVLPGEYCAGWIKRGPTGVIGSNKHDAADTVELLVEDLRTGALPRRGDRGDIVDLLSQRGVQLIDEAGWQRIDAAERTAGAESGRPRVKLTTLDALLAAARTP
ncbi:MAG: FAD-dependent oxidoreductase [Actinomycetales bacterium]